MDRFLASFHIFINMEKICTVCNLTKSISEFYHQKDRKSGASKCKKCHNKYCIQRWINQKIKAIEYKGCSCVDCQVTYPEMPYVIFDFHHITPSEKDFDWNRLRLRPWNQITKELDKCVLLCSNCHRIRHHLM